MTGVLLFWGTIMADVTWCGKVLLTLLYNSFILQYQHWSRVRCISCQTKINTWRCCLNALSGIWQWEESCHFGLLMGGIELLKELVIRIAGLVTWLRTKEMWFYRHRLWFVTWPCDVIQMSSSPLTLWLLREQFEIILIKNHNVLLK